jgi:hypothetical protein
MLTMSHEKKATIRPELVGVRNNLIIKAAGDLTTELQNLGLIDQDEQPIAPLTEQNFAVLTENFFRGFHFAIAQAKLNMPIGDPNAQYVLNEVPLTTSMIAGLGMPEVSLDDQNIHIVFNGPGPIVQSIESPLQPDFQTPDAINGNIQIQAPTINISGIFELPPGDWSKNQQ